MHYGKGFPLTPDPLGGSKYGVGSNQYLGMLGPIRA